MADLQTEVEVTVNASQLRAALEGILTQLIGNDAKQLDRLTKRVFTDLGANARSAAKAAAASFKGVNSAMLDVGASTKAVSRTIDALGGAFGKGFNPDNLQGFNDALIKLVELQAKVASGTLSPEGLQQTSQEIRVVTSELVAFRESFLAAGRAADEASRNIARDTRQASRVAVQESKASTARFVVDQQTQASAARDASNRRIALLKAAARTIATIERGISNIFRQTARVISSAFIAASNTISGVANGIGRAFTRTTTNIRNSVVNSNSEVSRSYRKSFGDTTSTVRNETRQQSSIINNFAREASSSISSIGSGARFGLGAAIGGILGVGAARALRGGFERATILENSERALTKLLSSAEKAKTLLSEVTEVVTGTPFRLDQFAQGATQLLAFNVEAEKIPEVLRTISDAAALSLDPDLTVDRLIRTFGQIQAAGKLTTEDLNQLTEAGVPAWALLGNQLGKTTNEMRELVTDGAVPASQAIDLLLNGIQNGTEGVNQSTVAFAGLSKELGGTLKGSLANFNTAISRLGANVITAFKEPLTAALGAATAAVDVLSAGLKTLAIAVKESATFQLLQRGLLGLTKTLKEAKTALQPFFEFISGGLVLLGQFAAALVVFRNIPLALKALASAVSFVLAPTRLLLAGAVLLASYFKQLYDDSGDLRTALGEVGAAVKRIATVVKDLAVDAFGVFAGGVKEAGDTTVTFGRRVLDVVVPALQTLSTFLLDTVLPPIRRFAKFIRTDVLPAIGTFLATAAERGADALTRFAGIVRSALGGLVDFVRAAFGILTQGGATLGADGWLSYNGPVVKALFALRAIFKEVFEFIGAAVTILWRGEQFTTGEGWLSPDGVVVKGLTTIRGKMESVVAYVRSDFAPVLAGLGVALGALALTGGNLPLAGIAGLTAGVAVALRSEDVRNALVDNIKAGVERARGFLKNLIDGDVLADIAKGALKAANTIGRVLGDVLTDRRLVAVVAAIAAFGVAVAASFAAGFVEGVVGNIPELVAGLIKALGKAFQLAVDEVVSDPRLAAAVVALIGGALIVRRLVAASRSTGALVAAGLRDGFVANAALTGGNTTRSFFRALVGGPGAVAKIGAESGTQFSNAFAKKIQQNVALTRALTGSRFPNPLGLDQQRDQGRFTNTFAPTAENLRKSNEGLAKLTAQYGAATVAGTQFRLGLQQIFTSTGTLSQGLANLGGALKASASALGSSVGAIAGGAFAASFVSQALFDTEASGKAKLQSALGTIAIGAATGAQISGTPQGAAIGAGVGAVGAGLAFLAGLNRELSISEEKLKVATEAAQTFASVIAGLADIDLSTIRSATDTEAIADAFETQFRTNLDDADAVAVTLDEIGFKYEQLDGLLNRRVTGGSFFAGVKNQLREAGVEGDEFNAVITFLQGQLGGFRQELSAEQARRSIFAQSSFDAEDFAGSAGVAQAATDAFKAKVDELNNQRIDGFRSRLDEARTKLDDAGLAVDNAKEKLRQFLAGENLERTAEQKINDAVIAVDGIARSIGELDLGRALSDEFGAVDTAILKGKISEVQGLAAGLLTGIDPADPVAVENALAPLRLGLSESGVSTEIQAQLEGGIAAAVTKLQSGGGAILFSELINEEAMEADAAAQVAAFNAALEKALAEDPLEIPLIAALAKQEFETVGAESLQGFADGFKGEQAKTAATQMGQDALAAAEAALGIQSPSTKFALLGRQSVAGYVKGMREALDTYNFALALYGRRLLEGVEAGIVGRSVITQAVARNAIRGVANAIRAEISNIAGVMGAYGRALFDGFIAGILSRRVAVESAAASVARSAARAVKTTLKIESPSKVFEELGRQTMDGFAAGIEASATLVADSTSRAVQGAIDAAVTDVGGVEIGVTGNLRTTPATASEMVPVADTAAALTAISQADIAALARAIAKESKPNVQIEQTFAGPVDSRAVAADVAWRLT
jgi:tape measure domain-containing protein